MTTPSEFPAPLLNAPWSARLRHFQDFTVAHPRLVDAKERLLAAIRECAPNSVILVLGPTGVGKTTLRTWVEQLLTAESLAALQTDPARLPVVSVEAVAPPSGNFNWRDQLSGQLSRRSVDVHFCRYRAGNAEDRRTFLNVLGSFERQMPLSESSELAANWEFLYERSIGCVGVLKEWLVRALAAALSRGGSKLTLRDLAAQALTISQCEKMLAEVTEGESRLTESDGARSRFRLALGLPGIEIDQGRIMAPAPAQPRTMPGQRHAKRDPIGKPVLAHETSGTV